MINYVNQLILRFILYYLPRRGKRIILLVLGYLTFHQDQTTEISKHEIMSYCHRKKVTSNEEVILFVMALRNLLYDIPEFSHLKNTSFKSIQEFYQAVPTCLYYDKSKVAIHELTEIIHEKTVPVDLEYA